MEFTENKLSEIIARNGGINPNDIAALAAILLEIISSPRPATRDEVE